MELQLEEGRNTGTEVCYVAKVLSILEDGKMQCSFLRLKNLLTKDTFAFPTVLDEEFVTPTQCRGVLVTAQDATKRQSDLVKVSPPLTNFNMH